MLFRNIKDKSGKTYESLTVIRFSFIKNKETYFLCRCVCGKEINVKTSILGKQKSCGCLKPKQVSEALTKHGESFSPEYYVWSAMKGRCGNPNNRNYHRYGGKGITVCERWAQSYENFINDMGHRPSPKHSIDRIKNNGNYEPSNCRWTTRMVQDRNMTKNVWLEFNGRKMILSDWAREINIVSSALSKQLQRKGSEKMFNYYKNKGLIV